MTKHYVYVLRSRSDQQWYVGLTNNLPARVEAHNSGHVSSTRLRRPLELIYWEGCLDRSDAARREKYLKSAWGKRYLKTRMQYYLTGLKTWTWNGGR
jgi:putative endonuclease